MIPIKDLKLYWPAWQYAVPITSYGYVAETKETVTAMGPGYTFIVHPEEDCWATPEGELMPIATSRLFCKGRKECLRYTSFSVVRGEMVQINYHNTSNDSYVTQLLPLEDVYLEGETFENE